MGWLSLHPIRDLKMQLIRAGLQFHLQGCSSLTKSEEANQSAFIFKLPIVSVLYPLDGYRNTDVLIPQDPWPSCFLLIVSLTLKAQTTLRSLERRRAWDRDLSAALKLDACFFFTLLYFSNWGKPLKGSLSEAAAVCLFPATVFVCFFFSIGLNSVCNWTRARWSLFITDIPWLHCDTR